MGYVGFHHRHSGRQRVVGLLLLLALCWATVTEFNHHHGLPTNLNFGAKAASQDQDIAAAEPSRDGSASRTPLTANDCAICQLHQNLFATLFVHATHTAPAVTRAPGERNSAIAYTSQYRTSNPGRAPPIIL
jgi:hypothetical protein